VTEEIDQTAAAAEAEPAPAETAPEEAAPPEPVDPEPMPPIESRFLYVGVAAKRAKQLRRGALPRLRELAPDPETGERPDPRGKLERVAMREVDGGLIVYEVPDPKPAGGDGA
jgi:DNA-directed RNA polymerase subunit K/omega